MNRRDFISLLVGVSAAGPVAVQDSNRRNEMLVRFDHRAVLVALAAVLGSLVIG
jgi:hypothetical protein